MTRRRSVRLLMSSVVLAVSAVSGCRAHLPGELGVQFEVTNDTNRSLHIISRHEAPGQSPDAPSPVDVDFTIAPHEKNHGMRGVPLSPGNCENIALFAYDAADGLVDQYPSPICQKKNGDIVTWVIKQK